MEIRDVLVVDAVMKLMHNVPHRTIFEAVYNKVGSDAYAKEKIALMPNLILWWGHLDEEHRSRLVETALHYMEIR
jgi:hypothetical protein